MTVNKEIYIFVIHYELRHCFKETTTEDNIYFDRFQSAVASNNQKRPISACNNWMQLIMAPLIGISFFLSGVIRQKIWMSILGP
jgi:hypothetical protein